MLPIGMRNCEMLLCRGTPHGTECPIGGKSADNPSIQGMYIARSILQVKPILAFGSCPYGNCLKLLRIGLGIRYGWRSGYARL